MYFWDVGMPRRGINRKESSGPGYDDRLNHGALVRGRQNYSYDDGSDGVHVIAGRMVTRKSGRTRGAECGNAVEKLRHVEQIGRRLSELREACGIFYRIRPPLKLKARHWRCERCATA